MSDFPSTKFQRGKIFAKSGLKLGTNYAKFHLQQKLGSKKGQEDTSTFHTKNAEQLFKEFSKLRGTALKMAQAISIDQSVLPEEFADVLSRAQYKVPPINQGLVRQIIKQELGKHPEDIFAEFDPKAEAAASLGQVHRARLKNGKKVAVKVQYPGIRDTISSDLAMGKFIFSKMAGGNTVDQYFEEVRGKLMEETDYTHEGQQIEIYSKRYSDPDFVTPNWLPEYSTSRVLTMTYLDGIHIGEFLDSNPSQEDRNRYGQLMWDFFHAQVNKHCTVHADSHPGNFIYTEDKRLGILDFGCIKECPPDFFRAFLSLMPVHFNNEVDALLPLYYDLEFLYDDPHKNKKEQDFYQFCLDFGDLMSRPYRDEIFDFSDPEYNKLMTKLLKLAAADGKPRGSRHFVYIARVVIGLYRMLIALDAKVDTRDSYERITSFLGEGDKKTAQLVTV